MSKEKETYRVDNVTSAAGLLIKTQVVKRNILAYMKRQNYLNFNPKLEVEKDKCHIQIAGAHVAIAAVIQELLKMLIEVTIKNTDVDKSGMKNVCRKDMSLAINTNVPLNNYYFQKTIRYFESNDADYMAQMPVDEDNVNHLLTTIDPKLNLTGKCRNFLAFLVSSAYIDIVRYCVHLMKYRKQNSMRTDTVNVAIDMLFLSGVADRLKTAVDTAAANIDASGAKDADDEGAPAAKDDDDGEDEPVAKAKSTAVTVVDDDEDDDLANDEEVKPAPKKAAPPAADEAKPVKTAKAPAKPKAATVTTTTPAATPVAAASGEKKAQVAKVKGK